MVPSASESHTRGPRAFAAVLRMRGAAAFSATGLLARLPISMIGLSIVLLVTSRESSYALAGALSASFALSAALVGPYGARFIDRLGQSVVLPVLALAQAIGLVLLVVGVDRDWPLPALFAIAVASGGVGPNIGSLVRARWIGLLRGDERLGTAFAWESILDEVVFIVGPPLATFLAIQASPTLGLLVCAALIVVGSLLLALQRRSEPAAVPKQHGASSRHAMLLPGMPWLIALMVLLGAVFGSFEVTTVAFAAEEGAADATGWLLAAYAGGSLVGGVLFGSISLSATLVQQLRWSCAVLAVVTLPLPLVPSIHVLAVFAAAAGFAVAPVLIISTAVLELMVPAARITEALTVTSSGIAVGLSAAAPLSGLLIDTRSASSGYLLMAGAAAGTFLVMVPAHRTLARLAIRG